MSAGFPCLLLSVLMLLLAPVCFADHLPENLLARTRPEKKLAGISLERSRVSDVVEMYGEPPCVIKRESAGYADSYDYYWYPDGVTLHVFVESGKELAGNSYISMIEIEGSAANAPTARTGAGLELGAKLSELKRIYGRRFKIRNIPEYDIHDVTVQWRSGYTLTAKLDRENRIETLSLLSPQ
ncbi:MAG: hypothetical protein M3384_09075 [Acidobacteriota bacterium]|nr:hypothetical protein [Acidobacteriota bacterium]